MTTNNIDIQLPNIINSLARVAKNHKTYVLGETPSHLDPYNYERGGVVKAVKARIGNLNMYGDGDLMLYPSGYVTHRPESPYSIY